MATQIIKGNALMLFDKDGKSYAYATNHTLSLTAETSDTSSKDHGMWSGVEVTKYSWEISSENLFTETDYYKMFDQMVTGESIKVRFGLKAENDPTKTVVDGDYENWTSGDHYLEGTVYITSLEANAANGENATYSVTLTGTGKLANVTSND